MEGGYALLLEEDSAPIGFAMGYFKVYDDIVGYTLEEILIAAPHQNKGLGSMFLSALEERVQKRGAANIELLSVNDALHDRYYSKAEYTLTKNLIPRHKWLS